MIGAPVDILMATRNGARFVGEQVASLQVQTHSDWRLLVSDDCSSDGTLGIVRGLEGVDPRIRIVSEDVRFGSAKANFMHLLSLSEAPYAMFCDQDDVWLPEKVERTLGRMRELEREYGQDVPLLVFADMAVVDEDLGLIAPSFERYANLRPTRSGFRDVMAQALGAGCTFMMNKRLVGLALFCVDQGRIAMHDWWVSLVASAFGHVGYIDEPLALYRQHGLNSVGAVKFGLGRWARDVEGMAESQDAVAEQADCFAESFSSVADRRLLAYASECAAVGDGTAAENILFLARSGAWKTGARKAGQIVAAIVRGGVVAVVITYNPDITRLRENLASVSGQVKAVFVYDNGSRNSGEIDELAREWGCIYAGSLANEGMSRALNRCCSAALECGARYALLLDQDSVSGSGMVKSLLALHAPGVGLACPRVVDRNKLDESVCGDGTKTVKRCITSGSLVSLSAWRAVGGFDERLFVDWVDVEFCANLRLHGYSIVEDGSSELLHEMGRRELAFTVPLLGRRLYRTNHAMSRHRDKARSQVLLERKYGWGRVGVEERMHIAANRARDVVLERHRLAILAAQVSGTADGMRMRSRKVCRRRLDD